MKKLFEGFDWKAFINDPGEQIALVILCIVAAAGIFYPGPVLLIFLVMALVLTGSGWLLRTQGQLGAFQSCLATVLEILVFMLVVVIIYALLHLGAAPAHVGP